LGTARQIISHPPFTIAAPDSKMPSPSEKLKFRRTVNPQKNKNYGHKIKSQKARREKTRRQEKEKVAFPLNAVSFDQIKGDRFFIPT
jgi:hypothetical protein